MHDQPQYPQRGPTERGPATRGPVKRRWPHAVLLIGVAAISFAGGIAVGSTGRAASPAASTSAAPAVPAQVSAGASSAVLATFTGRGIETTARFTVPGAGNWELKWSYDCMALGSAGNFIVDEDGDGNLNGVAVSEIGRRGSGVTHASGDAGRHYLDVNSECDWRMSAVSLP